MWYRYSGSGNTFIIAKEQSSEFSTNCIAELADQYCVDGVIFAEKLPIEVQQSDRSQLGYRMAYYNCNGQRAPMCGNGLRCLAHFLAQNSDSFFIQTDHGPKRVAVMDKSVEVELTSIPKVSIYSITLSHETINLFYMDTGVPHAVIPVKEVLEVDVEALGRQICYHEQFSPLQTNVNFVSIDSNSLRIRTYERGVERETGACGTGAAAAATLFFLASSLNHVELLVSSQERLVVRREGKRLFLRGDVSPCS